MSGATGPCLAKLQRRTQVWLERKAHRLRPSVVGSEPGCGEANERTVGWEMGAGHWRERGNWCGSGARIGDRRREPGSDGAAPRAIGTIRAGAFGSAQR